MVEGEPSLQTTDSIGTIKGKENVARSQGGGHWSITDGTNHDHHLGKSSL